MGFLASIRRFDFSRFRRPLVVALLLAALWFTWRLVANLDWRDLVHRAATANWALLGLAFAGLVGQYVFWDRRLAIATERAVEVRPRFGLGFFVLLASAAFNLITPSARVVGGPLRARYFARAIGRPFAPLYGVTLYDQLAHYVVMTTWTGLALVSAAWMLGRPWLVVGTLVAFAVLAFAAFGLGSRAGNGSLAGFFARRAERAGERGGRGERLYGQGREAAQTLETLVGERRLRLPVAALGSGYFLISVLAQWLIFAALGRPENPLVVMAVVALGASAGMLTGTPGGVGTTEAAMVALYGALDVGPGEAAAATLLFRGLHYVSVLALGVPALVILELRYGARFGTRLAAPEAPNAPDTPAVETSMEPAA
ncbi:MAG TPA: lysylphosphatidylglycerol synthase transmembrane domain-containing protein [Thermoanaerobaculia bacterium]|nr:lysylphosphatidylglycerol synthase transmembrane domain-containing protein [Thermoanaerobaculia bacterium]